MENLIKELLHPKLLANGTVQPPTTAQRRAAEAIRLLIQVREQDLQGRLKAEQEVRDLQARMLGEVEEFESAIKDAMNEDYMRNCT